MSTLAACLHDDLAASVIDPLLGLIPAVTEQLDHLSLVLETGTVTAAARNAPPALVRTAFRTQKAWDAVQRAFRTPSPDGFLPYVEYVDDPAYDQMSPSEVLTHLPGSERSVVFLADAVTETSPELLVLALRPGTQPVASFRLPPTQAWSVENNLTLANMDWDDFAGAVDAENVYRGF